MAQPYPNIRIVCVDDGSPDDSISIIREYKEKYDNIHMIHQENGGLSAARNAGLDWVSANSSSSWVCFVDSDDLIHPQMLELLYTAAMESGAGISMCQMLESPELPEDFCSPVKPGFETLTMVPFDLDAIIPELLGDECRALLNAYHAKVRKTLAPYMTAEENVWLADATRAI